MNDMIPVQIRWPRSLIDQLRAEAGRRHTTLSELVRQAAVAVYALASEDGNDGGVDENGVFISGFRGESHPQYRKEEQPSQIQSSTTTRNR